jgi:hypothetical protein
MSIEVYHNKRFLDHTFKWGRTHFPCTADLELAAVVDTTDKEKAWVLTNNIDHPWPENPGVTCKTTKPRSTSVGDAVKDAEGRWWLCCGVGWKEFDLEIEDIHRSEGGLCSYCYERPALPGDSFCFYCAQKFY